MTLAIKILLRVVRRRVESGEALTEVLENYPKLGEEEKKQVRTKC